LTIRRNLPKFFAEFRPRLEAPLHVGFQNILVIKLSSMGDVLHALPAVCRLRDAFPQARLHWLVDDRFAPLLEGHPAVDRFLVAKAPEWARRFGPLEHVVRGAAHLTSSRTLRSFGFDLVVDLQGLFKTGVLAASTRAPVRLGFADAREGATLAYTHTERVPLAEHAVRRCLRLVERIAGPAASVRFDMPVASQARSAARKLLQSCGVAPGQPYLVVAPRTARAEKDWRLDRFAEVVRHAWRRWRTPSLVVGGAREERDCKRVAAESDSPAFALTGAPLKTVVAVLEQCRALVGLDSGPIHLAAALGKPVVAVFGPTEPGRFAPWGSERLVVRSKASCPACRTARWAGHLTHDVLAHRCMESIGAEDVIRALDEELERGLSARNAG
jgi:lipopolysaccharide heptosyltransferase I